MGWDAEDVALLKKLWAAGRSAAQIARRLGYSRNAVCAKLTRLYLKRGHKPPTAKPKIRPVPKRRPALLAACSRPMAKIVSRRTVMLQPKEFTKRQLYAMLATFRRTNRARRPIAPVGAEPENCNGVPPRPALPGPAPRAVPPRAGLSSGRSSWIGSWLFSQNVILCWCGCSWRF